MKKIFISILCLLLVTAFAGCNSDTDHFPDAVTDRIPLTIEKVIELSEKGESLTWNDFEPYNTIGDVGSGLYILRYNLKEPYYILIGGPSTQVNPLYIYLVSLQNQEECIDIRKENVEAFIHQ